MESTSRSHREASKFLLPVLFFLYLCTYVKNLESYNQLTCLGRSPPSTPIHCNIFWYVCETIESSRCYLCVNQSENYHSLLRFHLSRN